MRKKTMKSMVLSFVLICASSISAFSATAEEAKGAAPVVAVGQQSKRLAVFLDGTWNAVDDNTNVWRMKALCAPKAYTARSLAGLVTKFGISQARLAYRGDSALRAL